MYGRLRAHRLRKLHRLQKTASLRRGRTGRKKASRVCIEVNKENRRAGYAYPLEAQQHLTRIPPMNH